MTLSRYIKALCSINFLKGAKLTHCENNRYNLCREVGADKFSLYFLYTEISSYGISKIILTQLEKFTKFENSSSCVTNLFLEGFEFSITPMYNNLQKIKNEIEKIENIINRDTTFSTLYVSSKAHKLYKKDCCISKSWKKVKLEDIEARGEEFYDLFIKLYEFVCFGFDIYEIPVQLPTQIIFALYSPEMNVTFVFEFLRLIDVKVFLKEVRFGLIRFDCYSEEPSSIKDIRCIINDMRNICNHHYRVSKYVKGGIWFNK